MSSSSRRVFLASSAVGIVAGAAGRRLPAAEAAEGRRCPVVGFTKPFSDLSCDATADLVAEVGWDGVEVAVRDGSSTHIAPDRVEEDLPRMVEALRKRGKQLAIVTTSVVALDPAGERVLKATAAAGIPRVRLGFLKYQSAGDPARRVAELHAALADVAAACRDLGLQAGYQNHSGAVLHHATGNAESDTGPSAGDQGRFVFKGEGSLHGQIRLISTRALRLGVMPAPVASGAT